MCFKIGIQTLLSHISTDDQEMITGFNDRQVGQKQQEIQGEYTDNIDDTAPCTLLHVEA